MFWEEVVNFCFAWSVITKEFIISDTFAVFSPIKFQLQNNKIFMVWRFKKLYLDGILIVHNITEWLILPNNNVCSRFLSFSWNLDKSVMTVVYTDCIYTKR